MAMRAIVNKISPARFIGGTRMNTTRYSSDGRVFSEEEKAAENVYIRKMEKERLEKAKVKAEKEKAEAEKASSEKKP